MATKKAIHHAKKKESLLSEAMNQLELEREKTATKKKRLEGNLIKIKGEIEAVHSKESRMHNELTRLSDQERMLNYRLEKTIEKLAETRKKVNQLTQVDAELRAVS